MNSCVFYRVCTQSHILCQTLLMQLVFSQKHVFLYHRDALLEKLDDAL